MTRCYEDLRPTQADRGAWTLPAALRRSAGEHPDAVFLDAPEEGRTWTYAETLAAAERLAANLHEAGAAPGDRVLIMAVNSSQFVRTWLGGSLGGLVEVPLNVAYEGEFLAHQVRLAEARWAVVDDAFAERFVRIADSCSALERIYVIDSGGGREEAMAALAAAGWDARPWEELERERAGELPAVSPRDLASIFFTSGTTGPSKGVAMPHSQMYFFAEELISLTRLGAADTYMAATPLFHGNAQFLAAYPALVVGARFVVHSRFSASRWIEWIRESGVTVTNLLGAMMDFVWKQPRRPDDADNELRCVYAAPTASSVVAGFKERFGIEAFVESFGLTETSMPIMSPYGGERPPGAAGLQVAEWFDIRLVDPETDEEVADGEVGELVVRPRFPWTSSLGYYNMPEKTVEAWRNVWFHTGDGLRRDGDGWFYFVDRFKDALRRRGENISSYEVEQGVLSHPGVLECAVIGVPAEMEAGEDEVMAFVVPKGDAPDPVELWEWCDGNMPSFVVPRYLRFVAELPKTQSEKVRKAKLREDPLGPGTLDREVVLSGGRA